MIQETTDYRACPECEQNKIPFKKGVCVCGKQLGQIQYVKSPETFARTNYDGIPV
jgi:hypothetical protein